MSLGHKAQPAWGCHPPRLELKRRASGQLNSETPRSGRLDDARWNPVATRLQLVHRIFAIVLLTFLPLQFSWAAVGSYCGHETQAGVEHFGHHDHQHHASSDRVELDANVDVTLDIVDGKAPGALDLDCGHCHGTCSMMLNLLSALPGALSTAPPIASLDGSGGAHAPTRPERPQWLPLA